MLKLAQLATLLSVLMLAGCASTGEAMKATAEANAAIAKAHAETEATPLLDLEITDDGRLRRLKVGRQSSTPQYVATPIDPTIQVWDRALSTVGMIAAPWAALKGASTLANTVGQAAGQGYKYIQSPAAPVNTTTTTNNTTTSTSSNSANTSTVTNTASNGSAAGGGAGSYAAPTTSTATNTTNNNTNNSTATPTVVTVPAGQICTTTAAGVLNCH